VRVRDLFDVPGLGLRLLTDVTGLDRAIRHVYTTDLPDPSRYLTPGDLVLTGLGRVVGGTGPALPGPLALRLASEYLRAGRLPAVAELTAPGAGGGTYTLLGVGGEPRITSWFLACPGRDQDWPHELRESVAELAADVALERARLDAAGTGDRKLAEAIVGLLAAGGEGAAPAEELAVPLAGPSLAAPLGEEIILLIPVPEDLAEPAHAFAAGIRVTAGVSAPVEGVTALAGALQDACAAKMSVHVNTVRYRIRRIEELTGRDLSCLDDQVDFYLALQIR
jgi:hypothetical protein